VDFMRGPEFSPIIALGDSGNDIAMLQAADIAVVIASPTGRVLNFDSRNRVIRTALPGPEGWAEAVSSLLGEL